MSVKAENLEKAIGIIVNNKITLDFIAEHLWSEEDDDLSFQERREKIGKMNTEQIRKIIYDNSRELESGDDVGAFVL
jgi:hypothetical protein